MDGNQNDYYLQITLSVEKKLMKSLDTSSFKHLVQKYPKFNEILF